MFIVSSKQMYQAESNCVNRGTTFTDLMEKAGTKCAEIIYDTYCADNPKNVIVLCGKGKNGGDGFVIARRLNQMGCTVSVLLTMGAVGNGDPMLNYSKIEGIIPIFNYTEEGEIPSLSDADIIVDAIFGTGFRGALSSGLSALAKVINASGKPIISIDVPSGADCDSATFEGEIFAPEVTIAISALKPIHIMKPMSEICGKVVVADIGIIPEDFKGTGLPCTYTLYDSDIKAMLPERFTVSNKGTYGNALCLVGSYKMPGAAFMSVSGALRSGAGLVTAAFPKSMYEAVTSTLHECVTIPCSEGEEGTFNSESFKDIYPALAKCNAVLAGCGMGLNDDTKAFINLVLKNTTKPLIIDADGLNAISENPAILKEIKAPVIITPHPGEMSRLTGKSVSEIVANPKEIAVEFAKEYNCIVVLKGANTVVTNGTELYINQTGNNGLAKGGSGDLLSGIMVSLSAQGMDALTCAEAAVYIHGDLADYVANKLSARGMLVTDLIENIAEYYKKFE